MSVETKEDQKYIKGIRAGDPKVIRSIYEKYHEAIVHLVESQHGTKEDAHDVFQEGMVVLFQKTKQSNFELTSSFLTYFYAVCRNIWFNKLRKKSNNQVTLSDKMLLMLEADSIPELELSAQYFLYRKMFLKLGEDCQKVLNLFLQKVSMQEIMKRMSYGSIGYTKKRKFLCKEKLVRLIQADPSYNELKMENL